ncbi:MAG TPA: methylmalonyl Co-A mutase-associated GTPase MeaB, partial [Bacteroidales bacterium]|nr:methylmalonyl Co-A mutase-associated GTPase MeaB [Bacteroidales bacterium]
QLAMGEYKNALHLFPPAPSGFIPKVQCCSALEGYGIPEVWQTVLSYENTTKNNGFFAQNRANQEKYRMYEAINEALQDKFYGSESIKTLLAETEKQVMNGKADALISAKKLLDRYFNG